MDNPKNMRWLFEKPIAHRGLHDDTIPENTLEAFANAIRMNYPIELDIRQTKDGTWVIFHDEDTQRMTGKKFTIADTAWQELSALRIKQKFTIPTFSETLKMVDGKTPLLIEIKADEMPDTIASTLQKTLSGYTGSFAVQSFNSAIVAWFRENNSDIPCGQLIHSGSECKRSQPEPDFFACKHTKMKGYNSRKPLLAWTVRNREEAVNALLTAQNIIFEGFMA